MLALQCKGSRSARVQEQLSGGTAPKTRSLRDLVTLPAPVHPRIFPPVKPAFGWSDLPALALVLASALTLFWV